MVHLLSNLLHIFGFSHFILSYFDLETKTNIKTAVIVFLVLIYFFTVVIKNSKNKNK